MRALFVLNCSVRMKRTMDTSGDATSSSKRLAAPNADNSYSSSPPPRTVELRDGVLPPVALPKQNEKHSLRARLINLHPLATAPTRPHVALPSETNEAIWNLVRQLPQFTLLLTHFTIAAATNGVVLCQSHSFDSELALDDALAALPLQTTLSVTGSAAGFNHCWMRCVSASHSSCTTLVYHTTTL